MLTELIADHVNLFEQANLLKTAQDLAKFLGWKLQAQIDRPEVLMPQIEDLFHDFRAVCFKVQAPLPEMPKEFLNYRLTEFRGKANSNLTRQVKERLRNSRRRQATTCLALCSLWEIFPGFAGNVWLDSKIVLAKINLLLMELGKEPILPDPAIREVAGAKDETGPAEPKKLLIVDDSPVDILASAKALAGWPNLNIDCLLYKGSGNWNPTPEQTRRAMQTHAEIIASKTPDIVLMDQGLGPNQQEGSELIGRIRDAGNQSFVFVANTGGDPDKLYAAGAYNNFCKGHNLKGIREAIKKFK